MKEGPHQHVGGFRRAAYYVLLLALLLAAIASLLPWVETNTWWIRYLDFVRLQVAVATVVIWLLLALVRVRPGGFATAIVVLSVLGVAYHGYKLFRYQPYVPPSAVQASGCPEGARLRLMVANVKRDNQLAEPFLKLVRQVNPDVLVALETDAWWNEHLQPLQQQFPYAAAELPKPHSYWGMHIFSKFPLASPEFKYLFDSNAPTFFGGLQLPAGQVQLVGLHPQPPQAWSQPTTQRDAHMLQVALDARSTQQPTIVAGDFNAVPWERVTRRMIRIGRLLDPRVGRGFIPTYKTDSWIESWPLDQILFQPQITLGSFQRLPDFGSDHYPVLGELCMSPGAVARQHPTAMRPGDMEEAQTSIAAARQMK